MASACRSLTLDNIFQYGIRFYWKGKMMILSANFKSVVDRFWVCAGIDSYDYICTLGVVPMKLSKIPGSQDMIPVVLSGTMGLDWKIVVRTDQRTGIKEFLCYRLRNKKNSQPIQPRIDTKVTVLSGKQKQKQFFFVLIINIQGTKGLIFFCA